MTVTQSLDLHTQKYTLKIYSDLTHKDVNFQKHENSISLYSQLICPNFIKTSTKIVPKTYVM